MGNYSLVPGSGVGPGSPLKRGQSTRSAAAVMQSIDHGFNSGGGSNAN